MSFDLVDIGVNVFLPPALGAEGVMRFDGEESVANRSSCSA